MSKTFLMLMFLAVVWSCSAPSREGGEPPGYLAGNDKVNVIFFHGRQRCISCNTIQSIAKSVVEERAKLTGEVVFHEINFTRRENFDLAEKYKIGITSLIISKGANHTNLTVEAFNLALTDPGQLESLISNEITRYIGE